MTGGVTGGGVTHALCSLTPWAGTAQANTGHPRSSVSQRPSCAHMVSRCRGTRVAQCAREVWPSRWGGSGRRVGLQAPCQKQEPRGAVTRLLGLMSRGERLIDEATLV